MRIAALLLAAAAVSLAAGCRNGAGSEPAQPMPNVTPIDTRASAEPAADDEPPTPRPPKEADPTSTDAFEGTAGATDKPRAGAKVAVLRDVRAARHEHYDRIVFEFEGDAVPGYHIDYIDKPVRQCGSGEATEIAGDAWLAVRMTPAAAHNDAGNATVPFREQKLALGVAREIERTCDFEAEVTWVLGVSSPNRYRVLELTKPARLVVDVKH
ncbi:AMIN-like domain-containing (lipo)protein [Sorangium sp. So ce124]|uniref:AMIN-like domain-containing (lipo)protein n=1 Tax=Sorangium sp. So ce124 TaxID=3133280 RepID=UPI003F6428AC